MGGSLAPVWTRENERKRCDHEGVSEAGSDKEKGLLPKQNREKGEEEEEERRKSPLPDQTWELEREVSCVFSAQTRPEIRKKGRRRERKRKRGLERDRAEVLERETGAWEREGGAISGDGQWHFPAMGSGVSGKPTTQTLLVFVPRAIFAR
jgi:hypothetical protein